MPRHVRHCSVAQEWPLHTSAVHPLLMSLWAGHRLRSAWHVLCIILCLGLSGGFCQTRHELTLEQSIARALQQSHQAHDVMARYRAARHNAESGRRRQWTSVALTATAPDFTESLSQQFNPLTGTFEYYRLKQTNLQGSLAITQPLSFTGGTLRFSQFVLHRNQTSGLPGSGSSLRDFFGDMTVEYQQPLLTPNLHRINTLRAELALDEAESDFMQQQADFIFSVTQGFYAVYRLSRQMEITQELVRQNEESHQTALSKSRAGLIPEVEALQSEVDLAASRNDSLNVARELAAAKNALRLLVGIADTDDVEVTGDVTYSPLVIPVEQAVSSALERRADVLNASRSIQLREADVDQARSRSGFRLDLTARYGLNRNDERLREIFHDRNTMRAGSLTLSVPLFDWGSAGMSVEAASILYRNAIDQEGFVRQQVRQEILDLVNQVHAAESRLQVLEKSVGVAQKGYDISLQRFRNGNVTRNDLAQSQQRLTNAKTSSLAALIDYQIGFANLRRKTLWDFQRNEPVRPVLELREDQ